MSEAESVNYDSRIQRMLQRWSGVRGPPRPTRDTERPEVVTSRQKEQLTNRESILTEDAVIGQSSTYVNL